MSLKFIKFSSSSSGFFFLLARFLAAVPTYSILLLLPTACALIIGWHHTTRAHSYVAPLPAPRVSPRFAGKQKK
jgi:hypothetical protein